MFKRALLGFGIIAVTVAVVSSSLSSMPLQAEATFWSTFSQWLGISAPPVNTSSASSSFDSTSSSSRTSAYSSISSLTTFVCPIQVSADIAALTPEEAQQELQELREEIDRLDALQDDGNPDLKASLNLGADLTAAACAALRPRIATLNKGTQNKPDYKYELRCGGTGPNTAVCDSKANPPTSCFTSHLNIKFEKTATCSCKTHTEQKEYLERRIYEIICANEGLTVKKSCGDPTLSVCSDGWCPGGKTCGDIGTAFNLRCGCS